MPVDEHSLRRLDVVCGDRQTSADVLQGILPRCINNRADIDSVVR